MRTTIRLDDELLNAARKLALENGSTLTKVIAEALRTSLLKNNKKTKKNKIILPSSGKGGLVPGIDLDDTASLLDIMEK